MQAAAPSALDAQDDRRRRVYGTRRSREGTAAASRWKPAEHMVESDGTSQGHAAGEMKCTLVEWDG
jgi:hypothetical protein